jgi:hypothetical protein
MPVSNVRRVSKGDPDSSRQGVCVLAPTGGVGILYNDRMPLTYLFCLSRIIDIVSPFDVLLCRLGVGIEIFFLHSQVIP